LESPAPAGGAHSTPSVLLAGLKGPTSKGRGGRDRGVRRKGRGRERDWGEGGMGDEGEWIG